MAAPTCGGRPAPVPDSSASANSVADSNVEWQDYFNPKMPKLDKPKAPAKKKPQALEKWDEASWDDEKINTSPSILTGVGDATEKRCQLRQLKDEGQTQTRISLPGG
jgi:hypothetical protein